MTGAIQQAYLYFNEKSILSSHNKTTNDELANGIKERVYLEVCFDTKKVRFVIFIILKELLCRINKGETLT